MELSLKFIAETPNSTLSALTAGKQFICFVIEDGNRTVKVPGDTRIGAGRYEVKPRKEGKFFNLYSKKFGHEFVPHLQDVPNFTFILIHIGNTVKDTRGCLLVGESAQLFKKDFVLTGSTIAYKKLYEGLKGAFMIGEKVFITVERDN